MSDESPENTSEYEYIKSTETTEPSAEVLLYELHQELTTPIVIEGDAGNLILNYIRGKDSKET